MERFKVFSGADAAAMLHALAGGDRAVTELVAETGGPQVNVPGHLGMLPDAGVVEWSKQEVNARYEIWRATLWSTG